MDYPGQCVMDFNLKTQFFPDLSLQTILRRFIFFDFTTWKLPLKGMSHFFASLGGQYPAVADYNGTGNFRHPLFLLG
jgi:hypothetical protein